MHREHKAKKENQKDATTSMFIIKLSISTCFGHHYAHLQENSRTVTVTQCTQLKTQVHKNTANHSLHTQAEHPVHSAPSSRRRSTRTQPTTAYTPRLNTQCTVHPAQDAGPQEHSQPQPTHPGRTPHAVGHGFILLMMGIMIPETCWDRKFDNKHRISCILLVLFLHLNVSTVN